MTPASIKLVGLLAADPVSGLGLHHPIIDPHTPGFEVAAMHKVRATMLACGTDPAAVDRLCYAVILFDFGRYEIFAQWSAPTALRLVRANPAPADLPACTVVRGEG